MNVARSVLDALRRDLYPATRYVWAEEVRVPGGRRVDAACIDTRYRSACTEGFEVKVTRQDFLNEDGCMKSRPARAFFDRFWYVFGSPDIVSLDEVTASCGVIVIENGQASVKRPAKLLRSLGDVEEPRHPLQVVLRRYARSLEPSGGVRRRGGRDPGAPVRDDGAPLDLP